MNFQNLEREEEQEQKLKDYNNIGYAKWFQIPNKDTFNWNQDSLQQHLGYI